MASLVLSVDSNENKYFLALVECLWDNLRMYDHMIRELRGKAKRGKNNHE